MRFFPAVENLPILKNLRHFLFEIQENISICYAKNSISKALRLENLPIMHTNINRAYGCIKKVDHTRFTRRRVAKPARQFGHAMLIFSCSKVLKTSIEFLKK